MKIVRLLLALALLVSVSTASRADEKTLYERLGGEPAIHAVVDQFVANVADDSRINHFFSSTDIPHLKSSLADFLVEATGGPPKYHGKSMKRVHEDMKITDHDWDAIVEDLVAALDKFHVPDHERKQLLDLVGSTRADIVSPHL